MNFNLDFFVGMYRAFGRNTVRGMLLLPSGPLLAQQKKNKDEPQEIIDKRNAVADAMLDLIEEYANFDND